MYLKTERLIIRSIRPADKKAFIEMASDCSLDEDIFCGYQGNYNDLISEWITDTMQLDKEDNPKKDFLSYTIAEKETGKPVGSVGSSYYEDSHQIGIVYFVGANYRGNGYASEATIAYLKYFFEHYSIPKIIATIRTANIASCKSAEKAGFLLLETKMYRDLGDTEAKLYNFYEMTNENLLERKLQNEL